MLRDKEDIKQAYKKLKQAKLKKVLIIAQTTYNMKKFDEIVEELNNLLGNEYEIEVKNTLFRRTCT